MFISIYKAIGYVKMPNGLSFTYIHRFNKLKQNKQEIRSNFFFIINTYLRSLEAISRACSGHPKGRLSFGSLSLWKILAMIIAEGLLNVASKIKNRPWFV